MSVVGVATGRNGRFLSVLLTAASAAFILFGGASAGAQSAGTYNCGTYGGAEYNTTDCSDGTTTGTTGTTSTSGSSTSTSTGSSSTGTTSNVGTVSGTTANTGSNVSLNTFPEYVSGAGKSIDIKVGQVISFVYNYVTYTMTVNAITTDKVVLSVSPFNTPLTVALNSTVSYDANQDGNPDISLDFTTLSADKTAATVTFKAIAAPAAQNTAPTTTGSTSNASTGGVTSTAKAIGMWWIWLIPIIVGLFLLIWGILVRRRRRRRKRESEAAQGLPVYSANRNFDKF